MKTVISPAKRFAPKKSLFFKLNFFILNFTTVLILFLFREESTLGYKIAAITIWLLALAYYIWQWTNTFYKLEGDELFYRSGFTKGHILVNSIRKIHIHSRAWGDTFAALTNRGLMITYNKWDEIFIAPKD